MKSNLALVVASGLLLGLLGACNRAESPAEVQHDVAEARQDAAADVADAARMPTKTSTIRPPRLLKSGRDVTVAVAEGDHKVAIEKCEALSGDAQKACKDQADAAYQTAKANAEARAAPLRRSSQQAMRAFWP